MIGPYAAMLTPFADNGEIDFALFEQEVDRLCNSRLAGLFPCGTSGEFIHMSLSEREAIVKTAIEVSSNRKPVVPGACATTERDVIKQSIAYGDLGCDTVVICPPWYMPVSQDGIVKFYQKVADEIGSMSIVVYNIPMCTQEISLDTFERLLNIKNVKAIKDSSGNLKMQSKLIEMIGRIRPEINVLSGVDECLLPSLMNGCSGSMTVFAVIMPDMIADIYQAFYDGDFEKAKRIQTAVISTMADAENTTFPNGYKALAASKGLNCGLGRRSC